MTKRFRERRKNGKEQTEDACIWRLGLDRLDRRFLEMIIKGYNGGPVGLETLASALGEESVTLEEVCEPFLMQLGFIARTPRGRTATALAYKHLGILKDGQQTLESI